MPARPRWNTAVLRTPQVLDVTDVLPGGHRPAGQPRLAAMYAQATGDPGASNLVGRLAHAGVVAVRTSAGSFEIHELLRGWCLARSWGDPDPDDLAVAAHIRATRLARRSTSRAGRP